MRFKTGTSFKIGARVRCGVYVGTVTDVRETPLLTAKEWVRVKWDTVRTDRYPAWESLEWWDWSDTLELE